MTPVDANSLKDLELAVERIKNYGHELNDLAEAANKAAQAQLAKDSKPTIDKQNEQIAIANREIEKIKLANKWGDDVGYDPQQEKFVRYPKPAQPVQPATPPAPDKK